MTIVTIHENDVGTAFDATIKKRNPDGSSSIVDISSATTLLYLFRRSNKKVFSVTPTFITDGTDGQLRYLSVAGDLTPAGTGWEWQPFVILPSGQWYGDPIYQFEVERNVSP